MTAKEMQRQFDTFDAEKYAAFLNRMWLGSKRKYSKNEARKMFLMRMAVECLDSEGHIPKDKEKFIPLLGKYAPVFGHNACVILKRAGRP